MQERLHFPSWFHIQVRCFWLEFFLGLLKKTNNDNEQLWHVLRNIPWANLTKQKENISKGKRNTIY